MPVNRPEIAHKQACLASAIEPIEGRTLLQKVKPFIHIPTLAAVTFALTALQNTSPEGRNMALLAFAP